MSEFVFDGERVDDLQINGLKIIQNPKLYSFTSDSVLLANIAKVKTTDIVCDLGSGTGIISILLAGKHDAKKVTGVEIQPELYDLSTRSAKLNNLNNVEFRLMALQNAPSELGVGSFNVVVANPPYFSNKSSVSDSESRGTARSEMQATLAEFIECASKLLTYSGAFYIIIKVLRMAETIVTLNSFKLEPKEMTLVFPKNSRECDTVIIKAVKGGNVGMKLNKLVVYNEDGTMTDEAKILYSKNTL